VQVEPRRPPILETSSFKAQALKNNLCVSLSVRTPNTQRISTSSASSSLLLTGISGPGTKRTNAYLHAMKPPLVEARFLPVLRQSGSKLATRFKRCSFYLSLNPYFDRSLYPIIARTIALPDFTERFHEMTAIRSFLDLLLSLRGLVRRPYQSSRLNI